MRKKGKQLARLKVKEIAVSKGISQGKLSRMSDVSLNVIRRIWDDENYSITTTTLERIARALNVSITELIEDTPTE